MEFQVLKGSFSAVYFNATEKGVWKKTNAINWLYLALTNHRVKIIFN